MTPPQVGAEGQTPLHLACDVSVEGEECVQLLLGNGADVHAQDAYLRTPLLVAAQKDTELSLPACANQTLP